MAIYAHKNFVVLDFDDLTVVDGATITVRHEASGQPLAALKSDRSGTGQSNPYVAADGEDAGFYAINGVYMITATKDAFTRTWRYEPLFDPTVGLMGLDDGSAAAPSLAFLNDPDTGLYLAGTNNMGFAAGGVSMLQLDGSAASRATGLKLISAAAGAALSLLVMSSGTNEGLKIDAKGSGDITLNGTGTGLIKSPRSFQVTATNAGFQVADGTVSAIFSATNSFLTNSAAIGTLNDYPLAFFQNGALAGYIGADAFWRFSNGVSMSVVDPTQSISFPTFDSTLPDYTTALSVTARWTGSLALAAAAISGQIIIDDTTTGIDELQGVYGGAANKRASHPGLYGVSGVINNYSTATTPSGSGLFGIVRGDLATVSGASVTGVTAVRAVSEVAAGQHPNAAFFCYNSVATNAFNVGYYCASAVEYGFRVGYGSGYGSNTIMPTYAFGLVNTSDVILFSVAGASGNLNGLGTITKTALSPSANTSFDGFIAANDTAASSGNQQYSPRFRWRGQGWKTNATAASQPVDWIAENRPVQNTVTPTTILAFASQLNGGGYNDRFTLNDAGGNGLTVTFNGTGSAQFLVAVGGSNTAVMYADASQAIIASLTSIPLILKTGNNEFARGSTGGAFTLNNPTGGLGYGTGAGGTITQATSKSTGVTLNKVCGQITMNNAALNAGVSVSFTLTNSAIAAADTVRVNIQSVGSADSYNVDVTAVAAGSCRIQVRNFTAGNLSEAIVLNFAVIKGATS